MAIFHNMLMGERVKVKVYGRRMKSDHKSSPCHFVTGELKIHYKTVLTLPIISFSYI
jgi:hypothetical protein